MRTAGGGVALTEGTALLAGIGKGRGTAGIGVALCDEDLQALGALAG